MAVWANSPWRTDTFSINSWNQPEQVITGESVTFSLTAASFDTRRRAFIEGHGGSSVNGAYWVIPGTDSEPDRYVWWSHDDYNLDPGDHVAELVGFEGIEIHLPAGNITSSARAAYTRSGLSSIETWAISGSGRRVTITGPIDSGSVEVGGAYTDRGSAGLFGSHTSLPFTNGNPFNSAIAAHMTFTAGPAVLTSIGILLGAADPEDLVGLTLYRGGADDSFVGTEIVADGITSATDDGSGNVYAWLTLTAEQSAALADNDSLWLLARCDQTNGTHPAFATLANREDLSNRNLVIITAGVSIDINDAPPSTLEGITTDESNAVVMMCAIEYRTAPLCGDGSLGGTTTNGLILGIHDDGVLAGQESNLTSPDPGGANVLAGIVTPGVLGMLMTRTEIAVGAVHTDQFRLYEMLGGAIGDPDGSTLLRDDGLTSGSSTDAWVGINTTEVDIPPSSVIHLGLRGNGGITIRFASAGNETVVNPPDNPSDFTTTAADEYETNTDNPNHSTDPTDAVESPFVTTEDDLQPTNYPGRRIRFRVPGDQIV